MEVLHPRSGGQPCSGAGCMAGAGGRDASGDAPLTPRQQDALALSDELLLN